MSAVKILTPRLSAEWNGVINWAIQNDVEDSLKLLIDSSVIHDDFHFLPTIIHRLGSNNCIETLSRWSKSDSYAYHLYRLIVCFQSDPSIISDSNILSDQKAAKRQLFSKLNSLYLLSLLIERLPLGELNEIQWFERLRLWLVVKAMRAASNRNLQDIFLRNLVRYLRTAADKHPEKLKVINQLMVDANGYHPFSRAIEQKAKQLLLKSGYKSYDVDFLKNLIKICNNNFNPDKVQLIQPVYEVANSLPRAKDIQNSSDVETDSGTDSDEEINLIDIHEESDADIVVETDVDPEQPQELKTLRGNSILLSTVEELQFLPWSCNKPNPIEIASLLSSNEKLLYSEKEVEQLLAVLVWVALNTGRSFRRALNIEVSEIGDDWALNINKQKLVRNQPGRKNSWLPKSQEEQTWLIPILETQEVILPEIVVRILNDQLSKSPQVKFLGQLWNKGEWGGPESKFLETFREQLPRLTPGMLGNFLPQKIFTQTENDKLARIIASHPRTGLPPASAYSAWLQHEHPEVFHQFLSNSQLDEQNKIAAGSRLYPIESLLRKSISDAGVALETIRQAGDLIDYHNHLTGYLYTMILAATGARPINDLIESISQIDLESVYLYVDDKSSSRGNKGRLLALPDGIVNYITKDYMLHLRVIAQAVGIEQSPLASEIYRLSEQKHSEKIPLLFFLIVKDNQTMDWEPVTATGVGKLNLFEWPLPANLFRHRLAKLLPAGGVNQEIVDGFLGHVESGLESYGDFSTRTFQADSKMLRPVLNKLFNQLGFAIPAHQPYLKLKDGIAVTKLLEQRAFGSVSRARERRARIVNAIQAARWEIEKTLGDADIDSLNEKEMEALSKAMLFNANGMPRSDGFLRYSYLIKFVSRFSAKSGKRVKLRKQYVFAESTTPFSAQGIHAMSKYAKLHNALSSMLATVPVSRFSKTDAALLSALIFGLENRVSDRDLLNKSVAGTNYRIVRLQGQHYAEFSSSEKIESFFICVKRFPITPLCAYWMQNAKTQAFGEKYLDRPVSANFEAIARLVAENNGRMNQIDNIRQLIRWLSEILNQANVMELPGVLAGYLSGRVSSYAWGWPEFIRFQLGGSYRLDYERLVYDFPDTEMVEVTDYLPAAEMPADLGSEEALRQSAKQLFRKVREALATEKNNPAEKTRTREGIHKEINVLLNQYSASVSQSCLLLVVWVKSLLYTKPASSSYYAISTVERYFSALSAKFEVLACATNLVEMDEEDITVFYNNILNLSRENDRAYVGGRLLGFHRWARGQGVEEPDWSEIEIPELGELVSPGFIFEEDYQNALSLLTQSSTQYNMYDQYSGLLLLLAYRFGLRGKEALGLLGSDVLLENGMMVVSVSDNRFRKLKTLASRRQVPLLFELSAVEKSIIDWGLNHLNSIPGLSRNTPLFHHEGDPLPEQIQGKLKRTVIAVLKQVTGNRNVNLHHARHTAANKISHALFAFKTQYKNKEFELIDATAAYTLLGTTTHTRREAWASARFLGHATRSTQLKNYIHFIGDCAAQFISPIRYDKRLVIKGVLDVDQFVVRAGVLDFRLTEKIQGDRVKEQVSLVDLMQLFRLLANGKQTEQSALTLGIPLETAHFAGNLLTAVSAKSDRVNSEKDSLGIFQKISPAVWKRLFEYIKSLNVDGPLRFDCRDMVFEIERLLPMFGARGHVLMRTEFQFGIMQAFIAAFNVNQQSFDVLAPKNADQKFILRAENYNFSPIVIGSDTEKGRAYKGYQLDAYTDSLEGENFLQRCGIVFMQENTGYARNSNNWILLIIIFITYVRSSLFGGTLNQYEDNV